MKGRLLPAVKAEAGRRRCSSSRTSWSTTTTRTPSPPSATSRSITTATRSRPTRSPTSRATGRLIATGNVKLTDPSGARVYSNDIDITDDFGDGFVDSLRVETPDKTLFRRRQRRSGRGARRPIFVNGVYTACEPCRGPSRESHRCGRCKAKRIIVDHKEQMIYFHKASMEFFGVPIAYGCPISRRRSVGEAEDRVPGADFFGYSDDVGWSRTTSRISGRSRRTTTSPSRRLLYRAGLPRGRRMAAPPGASASYTSAHGRHLPAGPGDLPDR